MDVANVVSESNQIQELPEIGIKDYTIEVCKRHAFFLAELPNILAQIVFNGRYSGVTFEPGSLLPASGRIHRGLDPASKLESIVFFMGDLKAAAAALKELPSRVIEVIRGEKNISLMATPLRTTLAKVASFISSWADVQTFGRALATALPEVEKVKLSRFVTKWSVIPEQLGNVCSMTAHGNKIYEYATKQLDSQKTMENEKNALKKSVSENKDFWDTAMSASIFALSSVFFTAGLLGVGVISAIPIVGSTAILGTRMAAFRNELQLDQIENNRPVVAQAKQLVVK